MREGWKTRPSLEGKQLWVYLNEWINKRMNERKNELLYWIILNETFDSFDLFAFAENRKYDLKSTNE